MTLDFATLMVFVLVLVFFLAILSFALFFRQSKIIEALHVIDENQKNIAKKQNEFTQKNQESNLHFWYEKLSQMDEKQIKLSSSIHGQIEKNLELFSNIQLSQTKLEKNIEEILFKRLENVSDRVDKRLESINQKVEDRLKKGFENIDTTFKDIIISIAKINQAQKNIENLSTQVTSLQDVLTDKKTRGIFGEVQLNNILNSIFGDKKYMYDLQYKLSNATIVDAIIKAPEPLGVISIDAKFPMENFRKLSEDKSYKSAFQRDMKAHVNAISEKYIIPNETADIAVLFLPAEAIFAHINAYEEGIIEYARSKSVWIASPTTLMALLTTILAVVRDIKTRKQAKEIQRELSKLSSNFKLYKTRWEALSKHIETVQKDVKDISTTTTKISDEFDRIENVDLDTKSIL